ncbi:MAG: hypothetical protein ABI180_04950 [Microcoleus sp.]
MGDFHSLSGQTEAAAIADRQALPAIEQTGYRLQSEQIKQTFLTAEPVQEIRQKLEKIELRVE